MANLRLLVLKMKADNRILFRPDFEKLVKIANSYGWRVKSYKEAKAFIKHHALEELTATHRAFVYNYESETIILYRDDLEGTQLLLALAHEIGHLVLQHTENQQGAESEADKFARLLIGDYKYIKNVTLIFLFGLFAVLSIKSYDNSDTAADNSTMLSYQTDTATTSIFFKPIEESRFETTPTSVVETPAPSLEAEGNTYVVDPECAVFISKSGNKYHRIDCYHINTDNCTMISEEQAVDLGYEPCRTCRPDVELAQPGDYVSADECIIDPEFSIEKEAEIVTVETEAEIKPIEINQASLEDFMTLPGMDEEKAAAILTLRGEINRFQHCYEILYADGVSQEFLASIMDYLYVES